MSAPISDDGNDSEQSRYAPPRFREPSRMPAAGQLYAKSAPTVPSSTDVDQDPRTRSEFASWPERHSEPSRRREDKAMRIVGVASLGALVAMAIIFAKPLWQGARALLDADSQTASKSSDRLTANNVPASNALVPTTAIATTSGAGSSASAPAQQAALSPSPQESRSTFRGVTASEIRFGISAAFSGPTKELGQNMYRGIEAAFRVANANGGVHGRQLRLIAADDGYEPARAAETMKQLYEKDQVFGVVGNVGTPTAVVALPYALERKMLFFGAFTGAGLLRNDPPDRYVFNYRASYAEETAATVHYLVKVRKLKPEQIAVFAQQDAYGDSGFVGVAKAVRSLGGNDSTILRLNYQRNTVDVDEAIARLQAHRTPIKAVIMVPAYRAAAKFIEKTRDLYPDMIYTSVSFVGSTAFANELMLLGKRYATGVIVTQVVPAVDAHSSLVIDYKNALAKYFPGEAPDYVSLEGYVAANVLIAALKQNGPQLDTERLVATLENLRDLDVGLGTPVSFSRSEHQGVHKVWGTQLDATGRYQPIDLQ
jgi:branched-chain amino acid transport system substrate-binding protein